MSEEPDLHDDRCPMCQVLNKSCPGGAHAFAQSEDGIHTKEQYLEREKKSTQASSALKKQGAPTSK